MTHAFRPLVFTVWAWLALFVVAACSSTQRSAEAFCDQLALSTGPAGAEVLFAGGDPSRVDALVAELDELRNRAPDEISTAVDAIAEFFTEWQMAPRNDRRELLSENESQLIEASQRLDDYALTECGLFLQRSVPTPFPSVDPGVEIAPE